jgi:hypothetical protein
VGRLRYSPQLIGARADFVSWWLVVDCDPEIGRYYRHLFRLAQHRCCDLQRPAWKEHITVIRDEEPPDSKKLLWKKYDGLCVPFKYSHLARGDDLYVWLDVESEQLLDIREELGLPRLPEYSLHVTIGNKKLVDSAILQSCISGLQY